MGEKRKTKPMIWQEIYNKVVDEVSKGMIFSFNAIQLGEFVDTVVEEGWSRGYLDKQLRKLLSLARQGKLGLMKYHADHFGLDAKMVKLADALEDNDFQRNFDLVVGVLGSNNYTVVSATGLYHYLREVRAHGLIGPEISEQVQRLCNFVLEGRLGELNTKRAAKEFGFDTSIVYLSYALYKGKADQQSRITTDDIVKAINQECRGYDTVALDLLAKFIEEVKAAEWGPHKLHQQLKVFFRLAHNRRLSDVGPENDFLGLDPAVMTRLIDAYEQAHPRL